MPRKQLLRAFSFFSSHDLLFLLPEVEMEKKIEIPNIHTSFIGNFHLNDHITEFIHRLLKLKCNHSH